jgi:glycosyltransferase involved in cell wall biosynthesis
MDSTIRAFALNLEKLNWVPGISYLRSKAFLTPRLGKLHLYPPRPLHIPDYYHQTSVDTENCLSISIVTPSFKSGSFIEDTIKSVLDQDYPQLKYVVQDGGSDDETVPIIKKYEKFLHGWESKVDKGQAHAINLGFAKVNTDIMAWLNADDLLLPGSLNYINKYFLDNPDVDVVYGHRVLIDPDNNETGRWVLPPHCHHTITWHDFIPQETLFWRRSIWEKAGGGLADEMQFALDWEFILRLRAVGANFVRLPRFTGAFRVHPDMKSIQDVNTVGVREMNMLREKYRDPDIDDDRLEHHIRSYLRYHIFLDRLYKCGIFKY